MTDLDDTMLRQALAPAREVTPTDDEIARALDRSNRVGASRRPHAAVWVSAAVLALCGVAYATPPTRAAIDDVTGSFAAWVGGEEGRAPGSAVRPDGDAPWWVRESGGRLIAESGGVALYVARVANERDGTLLGFSYGPNATAGRGVNISGFDTIEGWRTRFDRHALVVLGAPPVAGSPGRFSLVGVTARSVRRIELRYAAGPPQVVKGVEGGFVAIGDAGRAPLEVVAYGAAGDELERVDIRDSAP